MSDKQDQTPGGRPRILVVDDTEINRDMIGAILTAANYDVDFACDGAAGYEATWGTSYDLVLMDIEMPGMNGFEVAARIRAREGAMAGVTIAALTSTIEPDAKHMSRSSGIDDFIARPIEARTLVDRVSQILAERHARSTEWKPVWRVGTFSDVTKRVGTKATEDLLQALTSLLTSVASSIDDGTSTTEGFTQTIDDLLDLSSRLGFDELAGICRIYKEAGQTPEGRSRDPNLVGVVNRARYAIASHQRGATAERDTSLWARARTNVQVMLGKRPISVGQRP